MRVLHPFALIGGATVEYPTHEAKFRALAVDWLDSQTGKSRVDFSHPSHQQIIGMGQIAIPFILKEIANQTGHWFHAIRSIVGTTPVPADARGDLNAATTAWLTWGAENGYGRIEDLKGQLDADPSAKPSRSIAG